MARDFDALEGEPLACAQLSWAVVDYEGGEERAREVDAIVRVPGAERLILYLACLEEASAGRLPLDGKVVYTQAHRAASRSGILRWLQPPKPLALKDALAQMMITGDDIGFALSCEALAEHGSGAEQLLTSFAARLEGTSLVGIDRVGGVANAASMKSTAADLAGLMDALGARAEGGEPRFDLAIDADLAGAALGVLASVSTRDGLSAYLPGHGPFHTRSCHLFVDGGGRSAWEAGNWTDVALVYRDGRRAFAAALICKDVPKEVAGLPGGYLARRTMALMGQKLWRRQSL